MGGQLESGRSEEQPSARRQWLIKGGLFLFLVVMTVAAFPRGEVYEYTVQVGDTWRQPTLVAPFNFPIYKDSETVQEQRAAARRETPPYFREVTDAQQQMAANRDTLQQQLDSIFDAYASYRYHDLRDQREEAEEDSLRYLEMRRNARLKATPSQWQMLVEDYVERIPELATTLREEPAGTRLDRQMLEAAYSLGSQLLSVGVMNQSRDSVRTETIIVRNEEERTEKSVAKDNVYGLDEAYDYAQEQLANRFEEHPDRGQLAFSFFRAIFQPSLNYMRGETMRERERQANKVSAISGGVEEGEIIVSKGERVTEEIKRQLTSLERVMNERSASTVAWKQILGETTLVVSIYLIFFLYLYFLRSTLFADNRKLLMIALLFAFIVGTYAAVVRISDVSLYIAPVAVVSVLLTIIFDSRVGLFGTLVLACIGGAMLGLDLEYTLATFFAGMLGVFSVRDIKDRGQFFVSALIVFVGYAVVITASWLYLGTPVERLGWDVLFAAIGASFTIAAQILLWLFERAFGVTTDLTLLELSDTNRPLLKELSLRAPGTFNHSLQVANLAEAAADRIGAHALLARVGALYHDIGKMLKPEYYIENQRSGSNPHDKLKPRMSALIIASHVKEGVEMAKEYHLPEPVLKFIPMHHGTARIEYFYQRALEQAEDPSNVLESEFRYPGPRPDSKETGILMLADSVEAASRSLDEPTHSRLKSLIDLIFREHVDDGQLDNTDLTFRDLRRIKGTFLSILMGVYHVRVKYPGQEEEEAPVVKLETQPGAAGVSVVLDRNRWGAVDEDLDVEKLRQMSGIRDREEPRPEVAEASPYGQPARPEDEEAVDGTPAEYGEASGTDGQGPLDHDDEIADSLRRRRE